MFLTIITECEQTATCYKSSEQDLFDIKSKIKSLESFGPGLDFNTIKACTKSETNHTIGQKHIKILAENGLVHVKYDHEARYGAALDLDFHAVMADSNKLPPMPQSLCQPQLRPRFDLTSDDFRLGKRLAPWNIDAHGQTTSL